MKRPFNSLQNQVLLGDDSTVENKYQENILERLCLAVCLGVDVVIDLRPNNGKTPMYDEFWDVVSEYIEEKTAIDDQHHANVLLQMAKLLLTWLYLCCMPICTENA